MSRPGGARGKVEKADQDITGNNDLVTQHHRRTTARAVRFASSHAALTSTTPVLLTSSEVRDVTLLRKRRACIHRASRTFLVKAVRTLLIALLFGPVLGDAADDWPASNWIWELPRERQFTGLLTEPQFWRVVRELENRRDPSVPVVVAPHKSNTNGIEAAEILNGFRMDRYREQCEKLKHSELQGTPALYPTQIPSLESR